MKKKILIGALSTMFISGAFYQTAFADNLEQTKGTLQQQLKQKDELLLKLENEKKELINIQQESNELNVKLEENQKKFDDLKSKIETTKEEIKAIKEKIEIRQEVLNKRLVTMQQNDSSTNMWLTILLESENLSDILNKAYAYSEILNADASIIEEQQNNKEELEKQIKNLLTYEKELDLENKNLKNLEVDLLAKKQKEEQKISSLDQQIQSLSGSIDQNTELVKRLEKEALFLQRASEPQVETNTSKEVVNKKETKQPEKQTSVAPSKGSNNVVDLAYSFLGVPYVWGGASPSGFDCSGFISYVYGVGRQNVEGYWNSVQRISSPQVGDMVFFQNTYKKGPSHIGIYIGDRKMIHAGSDGIAISNLNSSYNKSHFLGYGRF